MDFTGAVKTHAEQEFISCEMLRHITGNQCRIGLETVCDNRTFMAVFLLQVRDFSEEVQSHQDGFASLPSEGILRLFSLHVA